MALKKSELYSSLWQSCDELRGGMDASQYKDYVLVLLFLKYISDKYAGKKYAPITIPEGASFSDMAALKGKASIGDDINKKIIAPLAKANPQLSQADFADFNDANKLGSGKEMVDRLTNLIAIFENPALDFSKNRADGDDLLGDAYEYLMRHFATESGKSKGQFLTPAEVSRVMSLILGIDKADLRSDTTAYDPTCGSASLLLKLASLALHSKGVRITLYGQEKDSSTAGLARMNMILHDCPTAEIKQGNTHANPLFLDGDSLKTFDFAAANPPFSDKRWSTGLDPEHDPFQRFDGIGVPPDKQGDYNLNLPRYIDSTEAEDIQDLTAHLRGGIPEREIKTLVVSDKWLATLAAAVQGELDRVSQTLTGRIRQLAERYANPLPQLTDEVEQLAAKVAAHLEKMGVEA